MAFRHFEQAEQTIVNINDRLTATEQQLRKQLIHHFTKIAPQPLNYEPQYQALLDKHIFTLNSQQQIVHLYPFSLTPTNKQVFLKEQQQPLFAMCAIDAIGIHFTLHQDIVIQSQCELTKTPITLTLSEGKITSATDDICILHTDLSDISDWANTCCNQMHFFINHQALTQWVAQYGCENKTYYSLSPEQATIIAKKLFYTP